MYVYMHIYRKAQENVDENGRMSLQYKVQPHELIN